MDSTKNHWANQKEQSAGRFRILLLWWIYRLLGKNVAKILFLPAFVFIYPFCRQAREALRQYYGVIGVKAQSFRHLLSFAWSMIDKTDACSLCKNKPLFTISGDLSWMNGKCFLLSTHVGCIEVLPALKPREGDYPKVNAFQQMKHNAVFTQFFSKWIDPDRLSLHAVEDIGVETAVEMKDAINSGEIVLMAADRLSALSNKNLVHPFFGRDCRWPKGVFRFAKLMESPIYAIVCVKTGWNRYEVKAQKLDATNLLSSYVSFLEKEVKLHPYQWYQFYKFWD